MYYGLMDLRTLEDYTTFTCELLDTQYTHMVYTLIQTLLCNVCTYKKNFKNRKAISISIGKEQ